jgi:hypothetical protein
VFLADVELCSRCSGPMCWVEAATTPERQMWERQKQDVVFATGNSILDRSCTTNVGG